MLARLDDPARGRSATIHARSQAGIHLALTATLLLAGCTNHDTKYRVAEDHENVPILAMDLGVADEKASQMGTTLLKTEPSAGRFPAGLCVIRVDALLDEATDQRHLRVFHLPKQHAVYWNHLFDDLPSIREVVFLGKPGLDPRGYDWHELLHAAAQRECSLCIMYARVEATVADAEYVGVLWDTQSLEPLATCRAPAVLPPDMEEEEDDDETDEPIDPAVNEADFRAEQDFRRLVRDTLWDLAKHDGAVQTTQPSPWRTGTPIFPRDYERYRDPRYNPALRSPPR